MDQSNSSSSIQIGEFEQFQFSFPLKRGIKSIGFKEVRPIQQETITAVLEGRDVMGMAETGTGKTAAFGLPIIEGLIDYQSPGIKALIIAPTRELAMQIESEIKQLARYTHLRTTTIYGGVSANLQMKQLRKGIDIVVACPGRLLDLLNQKALRLDCVETFVLDEADHLFDMGFLPDIKRIIKALPAQRQNLLFSATMPKAIRALAEKILTKPHVVELSRNKPASTIEHELYPVAHKKKYELLNHLITAESISSAIVFTRTKFRARNLARKLADSGRKAIALQGNMSQNQRDFAMKGFRKGKFNILVATDIAARGIDVAHVTHVVNFDMPDTPEAYTHRLGRTGRSFQIGRAHTFITFEDKVAVKNLEKSLGKQIPRQMVEGIGGLEAKTPPPKKKFSQPKSPRRSKSQSNKRRGNKSFKK